MTETKHGDNQVGRRTKLYQVWIGMRARCSDPKHISYKNYGRKGIRVDPRWNDYVVFKEWSYTHGYEDWDGPGRNPLWIDRINPNGHYCPENCRWVHRRENIRRTKAIMAAFGELKTLVEWSEDQRCKTTYFALRDRLNRGWSIERAITTPTRVR